MTAAAAMPPTTPARAQSPPMKRKNFLARYTHWLHTMWPAGTVEKLPVVNGDGSTNVPGLYVVGDLTGIPLLKFSADTGARAVQTIVADSALKAAKPQAADTYDLVIVGGGVSGMAAALEAKKSNLHFVLLEASEPFSTIVNFPKGKPIFTYPTDMTPAGDLQFHAKVKEPLVDELREQTLGKGIEAKRARVERIRRDGDELVVELAKSPHAVADRSESADRAPEGPLRAKRVIIAIGRSGNFRKLGVPGEDMGKVFNRLHDPKEWAGKNILVVGAGDSAVETAIAITQYGGKVTFSFRDAELTRPKSENIDKFKMMLADPMTPVQVSSPVSERQTTAVGGFMDKYKTRGELTALPISRVKSIGEAEVVITTPEGDKTIPNDVVFSMIGREAPLDFFRKSGVTIHGERTTRWWITLIVSICIFAFAYHWKKGGVHITGIERIDHFLDVGNWWKDAGLFPHKVPEWLSGIGESFNNPANFLGMLKLTSNSPGFYYSVLYCCAIVIFGIRRINRRKTPYVKVQTLSLIGFQLIPLFLLPYILLPWAGHNGWFDGGFMKSLADSLFPASQWDANGREYWRAFGFILAWPLFIWNVFTEQPMWLWLAISLVQTCVIIPAIIYFYGKGAYCGWICSCGALAETMGDAHRTKMPHGPFWNRFNMVGQAFLLFAVVLLILRVAAWIMPGSVFGRTFSYLLHDVPVINYVWFVDLLWAGILGVALYWHFSGRFWCRFACPLAALMHIYTRFSRFRILADKKKCISCNVCTSVCHQGIDVMNFANKGLPMADPECVRCSACVQSCPTGVLSFGQVNRQTGEVIRKDKLAASAVQIREIGINGRKVTL